MGGTGHLAGLPQIGCATGRRGRSLGAHTGRAAHSRGQRVIAELAKRILAALESVAASLAEHETGARSSSTRSRATVITAG